MTDEEKARAEYRKSIRDFIKGNTSFHEDGWGKKLEPIPEKKEEQQQEFFPKNWEGFYTPG